MPRFVLFAALVVAGASAAALAQDHAQPAAITRGVHHLGLTVGDLDASVAFFTEALGWRVAGGDPDYPSVFVTDGALFLTLWRAADPETATPFDRKTNLGLHHLAIALPDLEALEALHRDLSARPDVRIEFAPEPLGDGPTRHMMVYEPSGLRIEFIVPGGRRRAE